MPKTIQASNKKTHQVTVMYFASLADIASMDEEVITIDAATDLPTLYSQLADKYGFDKAQNELRVAINHNFSDWSADIKSGDNIAFIPPVAGG